MSTAQENGRLWGARARDWAEIQEGQCRALYESALNHAGVASGMTYLDAGCGAGLAAHMAAERGAEVSGLDASASFLEVARERTQSGDFRQGELEKLPFADGAFDVVTGFNSFQFADDTVQALREAKRVTRPGGKIVIAVWGKPEQCDAVKAALTPLRPFLPPAPPNAPGPFALSADGALQEFARSAGLQPLEVVDVECVWRYPDLETATGGLLSSGVAARAMELSGEEAVVDAQREALKPFQNTEGVVELHNTFRYLLATA